MKFLLLLVIWPVIEISLMIKVGQQVGVLSTLFLLFISVAIGLSLLKQQGFSVLLRAQEKLQQGEVPADEMLSGMFLVISGLLLIVPGFVSDALAFVLLIKPLRQYLLSLYLKNQSFTVYSRTFEGHYSRDTGDVIEGQLVDKTAEQERFRH